MEFLVALARSMPGAVAQGLAWGIMAIGVYITYKILDIADLTVDGSICTGGAVCIVLTLHGYPMWLAVLIAIVAGMAAGLVTGILHTALGIPAILAGILTQLSLYSINLRIMGKANLPISVDKFKLWVSQRNIFTGISWNGEKGLLIINPLIILAVICIVLIALLYFFFGREIGCALRATGANPNMSRAQGINVNFAKVLGLMISNGLVAFSGALLAQYQGFADINMGRGAIVIGLAAVIIGEVIFDKVFRNFALKLLACIFGSIIYYLVIQIVLRLGLSTDDLKLLTAVVVALFLAVPYLQGRYRARYRKKG